MSALFDPVFGRTAAADAGSDAAWIEAMLRVESALAEACAEFGLITEADAERVHEATKAGWISLEPDETEAGGNPIIPLVRQLRERSGDAIHFGATSQDILDTAGMLIAQRQLALLRADLTAAADSCARLAAEHHDTAMIGRTLLQHALPTTFGLVAAGWAAGLDRSQHGLAELELAVQLAGPAGTGAGWQPHTAAIRRSLAARLGLADPGGGWHTERTRIAQLAAALGVSAGAIGKIATDVVLLSQTELGELSESRPGGSSSMPHKQNSIAAVTARAGAAQAPGLVSTVLAAAGSPELQRGAGPWHAEWPALRELFLAVAGAANRLRNCLTGLQVHPDAMRRNLAFREETSG